MARSSSLGAASPIPEVEGPGRPAARLRVQALRVQQEGRKGGLMASRWVLVVEDDLDTRRMLREILELEGYAVREAEDGDQALGLLRSEGRDGCLAVVLDLMLPTVDGLQVLEAVARDPARCRLPGVAGAAAAPARGRRVLPQALLPGRLPGPAEPAAGPAPRRRVGRARGLTRRRPGACLTA